jgi:DNA-binding transcriptional regulator YdaS (Cro superfamily)
MNPIEEAIDIVGSQAELARRTGVSATAILKAKVKGSATTDLAEKIELATDGKVSRERAVWPSRHSAGVGRRKASKRSKTKKVA